MKNLSWILVALLALIVAGMVFKFIVQGSATPSDDGRTAVNLERSEKNFVLKRMRMFLESVQQISDGLATQDMQKVAQAARRVGTDAPRSVPGTLMGKLPIEFKKLGMDTHARFDAVAETAEQSGDRDAILSQLSTLMQNCVACHATYRFEAPSMEPAK